ncbi:hypothetical protein EXIGLDRAFT_727083 [Exidia glandulosa HHB12029]|uniref:VPS9 domain-containing protein n=1 Tax=Exidia glandulosa HHB12029 TaxID=1314781 RepID=A0A165M4K2_EXIGL|nr:hypothetical protein EXIGLDRAFT_727083 [Exidia glandulosa HHB12029]
MSSPSKDHLFPATSLGRSGGLKITRDTSRESLIAHPLLSPSSPTSASPPAPAGASDSPRYVPYTPRQRQPTSTSTPATTAPVTATPLGGATGKLQQQNMKAVAQSLGLATDSVGWAILQKLVDGENGSEWDEIWHTLEAGKATLLLPAENMASTDVIGPEFVKDHVAFCTVLPSRTGTVVTLSGLRASWEEDTATFRSTVPVLSKRFKSISTPETSAVGLLALPPLPSSSGFAYQSNTILAYEPKLPLTADGKPALPPRPGARSVSTPSTASVSRLSNPFASLFTRPGTPTAGVSSSESHVHTHHHSPIEVSALAVSGKVIRKEIYRDITIGLTTELKSALSDLPPAIVSKILSFVAPLYPSPKSSKSSTAGALVAPGLGSPPDVLSDAFQNFYYTLQDDLEQAKTDEKRTYTDDQAHAFLERVEGALGQLFYDQLYRPSESDDISHDEALASRVAALNMLDLSLDHLGVDTNGQTEEVEAVVRSCGDVLQRLGDPSCRTPTAKAALLVEANRVVVEGLSRLPPICLRPEGEERKIADEKPPTVAALEPGIEKEMEAPIPKPVQEDIVQSPEPAAQALPAHGSPPPLPPRPHTPPRIPSSPSPSPAATPTPVAGDILLPIIIFAVVKSNPAQLVSHLLYVQRFRARATQQGEESYCLVNLMAVVEFLENVDMGALGLGDSQRVMSVSDLTPIPLQQATATATQSASARIRGQVGEVADAAGKVLSGVTGVVDTSFGVLRGLLPFQSPAAHPHPHPSDKTAAPLAEIQDAAPWNAERPTVGFGMLRRASGFSIASLPGFQKKSADEGGQQMVEVPSRAPSVRGGGEEGEDSEASEEASGSTDESDDEGGGGAGVDARSVRSFSSMMSGRAKRMSLSDRLAHASKGKGSSPSAPGKSVPLPAIHLHAAEAGAGSSRDQSPASVLRIAPPNVRFMTANDYDLRLGEISELLREYRRVVEGMRALGGFRD